MQHEAPLSTYLLLRMCQCMPRKGPAPAAPAFLLLFDRLPRSLPLTCTVRAPQIVHKQIFGLKNILQACWGWRRRLHEGCRQYTAHTLQCPLQSPNACTATRSCVIYLYKQLNSVAVLSLDAHCSPRSECSSWAARCVSVLPKVSLERLTPTP